MRRLGRNGSKHSAKELGLTLDTLFFVMPNSEEGILLIVLGGLPATGKSMLAAHLARELRAIHLRVDTIEQAMRNSGLELSGPEGYLVACSEIYSKVGDEAKKSVSL